MSTRTKNLRLRRNQLLPSKLPGFTMKSKLPLYVGLPPSQVPFTSGAGTLRQSDIKKKSILLSINVKTRLVAYTRVITDSFRVFDRGRHSGHALTAGILPPFKLPPPRGDN